MQKCRECGSIINQRKSSRSLKNNTSSYIGAGILGLFIFGVIVSVTYEGDLFVSKSRINVKPSQFIRQIVTLNEYHKIRNGMSYRKVSSIIGAEGEETGRNKISGVPGVMPSVETVAYKWVNGGGGALIVMFQNDSLIQKSQSGLK